MSLIDLIFGKKKTTASLAKERLQLIIAHERGENAKGDKTDNAWLSDLQEELMQVIAKYIAIDRDALKVNLEKRDNLELLEINVTLPEKEENK